MKFLEKTKGLQLLTTFTSETLKLNFGYLNDNQIVRISVNISLQQIFYNFKNIGILI